MADNEFRILAKTSVAQTAPAFSARGALELDASPLFKSIGAGGADLGAAGGSRWYEGRVRAGLDSPWDACHRLVSGGLGVAAGDVEFAEPDLEHQWILPRNESAFLGVDGCGSPKPQDTNIYAPFVDGTSFDDAEHTGLAAARSVVDGHGGPSIRIAHIDTGFDPEHRTLPEHLRTDLQKNFTGDGDENDARDHAAALELNYGHGVATLALLAGRYPDGKPLGGAANLEVVPIRIANLVVLFRTSALAKAFDYVHSLWSKPANRISVVTMSMGGVASAAWADAVNALYERGILVVTAAGNNYGNLPTRFIVFPARFKRVVAAAGVMADGRPYADLPLTRMAGCYGPRRKYSTAIAAYTPNVPWARIGCKDIVDYNGNGTSSATPQVAAAAALWLQHHSVPVNEYKEGWMRVEAVRKALFESADKSNVDERHFGQGVVRARAALDIAPAKATSLKKQPADSATFSLFRLLTGLGLAPVGRTAREHMLELEALQLSQHSQTIEALLGDLDIDDPEFPTSTMGLRVLEAIADAPAGSQALRDAIATRVRAKARATPHAVVAPPLAPPTAAHVALPPRPLTRPLRVYAFDPAAGMRLNTLAVNEATIRVRWEDLEPGPVGEYLEVVDVDPASDAAYAPVALDHPYVLAQGGLKPSEGNPQFHQQMVYGVAMRTIEHFERALGRSALWAEREGIEGDGEWRAVRRLRIYPHALREANAYYSPDRRALLFGYFNASTEDAGDNLPGGLVFTCLSHDIVAHETVHALLDGIHPRFKEPTNRDMVAFHEAFADIVALFQHFSMPEALLGEMERARADLSIATLLGGLAGQFGQATGRRGALRSYIAIHDEKRDVWLRREPSRSDYANATEAHDRGAVLVAAIFDAFQQIFQRKTEDLRRLATGGTGILRPGALPPDLVTRLCHEAAKIAGRFLSICIRALDYCPPFDLTFGEYLRAIITADHDLVPDDPKDYRVALVSAFRARGIFPREVTSLSADALLWRSPEVDLPAIRRALFAIDDDHWSLRSDRHAAYLSANSAARELHHALKATDAGSIRALGLYPAAKEMNVTLDGVQGRVSPLQVYSVRPLRRIGPDGQSLRDTVIEVTQRWKPNGSSEFHRGGCTLICDGETREVRYIIRKRLGHLDRMNEQEAYSEERALAFVRDNYFDRHGSEPFALLHRAGGIGGR